MAVVAYSTRNPMGRRLSGSVRRPRRTLGALGSAVQQTTLDALSAEGADSGLISTLLAMGVTDEQLLGVLSAPWTDSTGLNSYLSGLMNQLGGANVNPNVSAVQPDVIGQVAAAATLVTNPFGAALDLSLDASWAVINSLFNDTGSQLTALAQQIPADAEVKQKIQEFNSLVLQWAGYYEQAEGVAPSSIPLASSPALSGLGIAPAVIIAGLVAAVAVILSALYVINQWIQAKKASIGVAQTTAVAQTAAAKNQASILSTYNALVGQANALRPTNPAAAAQLASQANALLAQLKTVAAPGAPGAPGAGTSANVWFSNNWQWIALTLGALLIVPPLMKKI